ncbi:MAG: NUDIX hydrolase [Halanaerobiaceae bacterium]
MKLQKILQERLTVSDKKPGILGKEEYYFNSSVAVLLAELQGELNFVFEKRVEGISQGREICFPGGMYEPEVDCTYKEAALRETIEELGVSRNMIRVVGQLDTLVAPMGATVDSFVSLLEIGDLDDLSPNEGEVAEVITVPLQYFRRHQPEKYHVRLEIQPYYTDTGGEKEILFPANELGLPERYRRPWGGKKYPLFVYEVKGEAIWGITAQLVREVVNILDDIPEI